MTDQQIADLGPAFAEYLSPYRDCFGQKRIFRHFDNYCRGLLSDLPRKSVEPIALACGTAVRTMQEFLITSEWEHETARERLQCVVGDALDTFPDDPLGNVGVIDETSCCKKGDETPGVQRQYLGCVGKLDDGIVTVHLGVTRGRVHALLDAESFLPEGWSGDRPRCRDAGIPDSMTHRTKWRIALERLARANASGIRFDWLTFDEGYGSCPEFLAILDEGGHRFVAEVPVSFAVRRKPEGDSQRASLVLPETRARFGTRYSFDRATTAPQRWRSASERVWVRGREFLLLVAVSETTAEVKYFLTNAGDHTPERIFQAAFRRATVEHGFRLAKSEAGLSHFEGRSYVGLMRHTILTLLVLGFVSLHADRLRGGKPTGDGGAGVPGDERPGGDPVLPPPGGGADEARRGGDPIPPAKERKSRSISQEKAD